jgi:hypothetical protein
LLVGFFLRSHLGAVLIGLPTVLTIVALLLIGLGPFAIATASLLVVWGLFTTPIPVAWNTWMTRVTERARGGRRTTGRAHPVRNHLRRVHRRAAVRCRRLVEPVCTWRHSAVGLDASLDRCGPLDAWSESMKHRLISRRALVGAALATAVLPGVVRSQGADAASQEASSMKVRFTFDGRAMIATLYDNPSARDFYSMLPLDLTIKDFSDNEKIAYLPRKLTEEGRGPFGNEQPYDLCYYMPWGNLAMFYGAYRHAGLIRLGRFDEGHEALHVPGEFPLRIEAI